MTMARHSRSMLSAFEPTAHTCVNTQPPAEDLAQAVAFIREGAASGEKVLVHCKAGHGRSGAVAMAWLLAADRDATPEAVQLLMTGRSVEGQRRLESDR